ncbi:MAG: thioesterase family protein [bacterium]
MSSEKSANGILRTEKTAWRSVAGELGEGQSTVGTRMEISHISATPVGMGVVCETELIEVDRRKLVFSVNVCDQAGKIAEGIHERFIVDTERFMEKAENKSE